MSEFEVGPRGAAVIAGAFAETFAHWGIVLPEGAVERGEPGMIRDAGWTIRYMFDTDDDGPYLEYYATHRMTSDSRYRVYGSGKTAELDAIWEMFAWDPRSRVTRRVRGRSTSITTGASRKS